MFGGEPLYIAKGRGDQVNQFHIDVRNDYRELIHALCQKRKISVRTLYRIIRGRPPAAPDVDQLNIL